MYDLIGFLLECFPDALMAQAQRFDGILYLPAYDLVSLMLAAAVRVVCCLFFVFELVSALASWLIRWIFNRARSKTGAPL